MGDITALIMINQKEVETALSRADFSYPGTKETEQYRGWSHFSAIPALYELTVLNKRCPGPEEGVSFLLDHIDDDTDISDYRIINRARKLWMDFCREIHTFSLLQHCDDFGIVSYQKALDIGYNVDYTVRLLGEEQDNGVNSSMRWNWNDDKWSTIKQHRRAGRGGKDFPGSIYLLSNKNVNHVVGPNRCWLFSQDHVYELVQNIKEDQKKCTSDIDLPQGDLFEVNNIHPY